MSNPQDPMQPTSEINSGTTSVAAVDLISSYTSDPELKSVASSLNKLNSSFAQGGKTESNTLDSMKELSGVLVESSRVLANTIVSSKDDVLKNKELRSLIDHYFDSTTKTLDLFISVENRAKKAKLSCKILQYTIKQFKKESMDTDFGGNLKKTKYAETLVELNKVQAMGDPFGKELMDRFISVREDQCTLLNKFEELEKKLGKKEDELQRIKDVTNIGCRLMSVTILFMDICLCFSCPHHAVHLAAKHAPFVHLTAKHAKHAVEIATGVNTVGVAFQQLINMMTTKRLEVVKREKNAATIMKEDTNNSIRETDTIKSQVDMLITSLTVVLSAVDFAVEKKEEEAIEDMMKEIIDEVDVFADKLKLAGEAMVDCSKRVASTKRQVLEHLNNLV